MASAPTGLALTCSELAPTGLPTNVINSECKSSDKTCEDCVYNTADEEYLQPPSIIVPGTVGTGRLHTETSYCSAPPVTTPVSAPDSIVISRVLSYLQKCDDEHRTSNNNLAAIAERDVKNAKLVRDIELLTAEINEVRDQLVTSRKDYYDATNSADEAVQKYNALAVEHATLKRHFDIIADGFSCLNTIVRSQFKN